MGRSLAFSMQLIYKRAPPPPPSTSGSVRRSRKCSTSFSNKASFPRYRRHYPSALLVFWASEVAQSPPTPPLMSLCLMLRFYQSTLCHSIMTNLFSLTSLTFATVILVPGAFDICSRDGCLASVLQNRESGVEKVAVKRDLPASFVSSGNCPVSSCARAPIRG